MTLPRLTIAQLMALILYVGLCLVALRNANAFWASTTFTVAIILVSVALVGAIARKGKDRMTWIGFAVFGWACVIIGLFPSIFDPRRGFGAFAPVPQFTITPPLLMAWACFRFSDYIQPKSGDSISFMSVCYSLEIILFGIVGAVFGRLVAPRDDLPNP